MISSYTDHIFNFLIVIHNSPFCLKQCISFASHRLHHRQHYVVVRHRYPHRFQLFRSFHPTLTLLSNEPVSISSCESSESLTKSVFPVASNTPQEPMSDLQRGSFQRKFRSLWFGTGRKKKATRELEETSRLKSLSSPSLIASSLVEKTSNNNNSSSLSQPSPISESEQEAAVAILPCSEVECECNQVCPCCIEDQRQELQSLQRNFSFSAAASKDTPKGAISQTLPKNFTSRPSYSSSPKPQPVIDDQYVVVVSDLESSPCHQLTVRTEVLPATSSESSVSPSEPFIGNERQESEKPDRSLASAIPDRMVSAESHDYMYKSSSASESGRGTLTSENERMQKVHQTDIVSRDEPQYSSVNKKTSTHKIEKEVPNPRSKYPQLYVPSTRAPMPAVIESESWVSDSSTFHEVVAPARNVSNHSSSEKKTSSGSKAETKRKVSKNSGSERQRHISRWKSVDTISSSIMEREDMSSDLTADIGSNTQKNGLADDLKALQGMYDKVFKRLTAMDNRGHHSRKKAMGSLSTLNSLCRTVQPRKTHATNENSKRIRRLEERISSLTKSLAQMSIEAKESQKLFDHVSILKKDYASLQQQMNYLQSMLETYSTPQKNKVTDSSEKLYSSVKKQSKISR